MRRGQPHGGSSPSPSACRTTVTGPDTLRCVGAFLHSVSEKFSKSDRSRCRSTRKPILVNGELITTGYVGDITAGVERWWKERESADASAQADPLSSPLMQLRNRFDLLNLL